MPNQTTQQAARRATMAKSRTEASVGLAALRLLAEASKVENMSLGARALLASLIGVLATEKFDIHLPSDARALAQMGVATTVGNLAHSLAELSRLGFIRVNADQTRPVPHVCGDGRSADGLIEFPMLEAARARSQRHAAAGRRGGNPMLVRDTHKLEAA
jgi:hypothetical protein